MEGGNYRRRWLSWKMIKRSILCFCGSSKRVLNTTTEEEALILMIPGDLSPLALETIRLSPTHPYVGRTETINLGGNGTIMNLASALAADRRDINVGSSDWLKVNSLKSIVRPFEELDGQDVKVAHDGSEGRGTIGTMCCLCTERNKGVALIPCGHTYCRVCSRVMWLKEEACPLCNRSIMDVLEMF